MQDRIRRWRSLVLPLAVGWMHGVVSGWTGAQCQVDRLVGSGVPLGGGTSFQGCLATDGDTIALGHAAIPWGAGVYVFVRSGGGWVEEANLVRLPHFDHLFFGRSVALAGDTLVAFDPPSGGPADVVVYTRTAGVWTEAAPLVPPPGATSGFGLGLALTNTTLAVGDPGASPGRVDVYVGGGATWTHQATLFASDAPTTTDDFGYVLRLEGDRLFVGAPQGPSVGPGAVYEFARSGTVWTEVDRLAPTGGSPTARFGSSLSLDGSTLAVGAWDSDPGVAEPAAVHVLVESAGTWNEQDLLVLQGAPASPTLHVEVALRGDRLLAGAPWSDGVGPESGAALLFERSAGAWTERKRLLADDLVAGEEFGTCAAFTDAGEALVLAVPPNLMESSRVYSFAEDPGCPSAAFGLAPTSGVSPLPVTFTDLSTGSPSSWSWDFGDGTPGSTLQHPQHDYVDPGLFDVSLVVENATGSDRAYVANAVDVAPGALVTLRNGSGSNPTCFASTSQPALGSTWTCEVDASVVPGAFETLVVVCEDPLSGIQLLVGELLVSPLILYEWDTQPVVAGFGSHAFAVPADPDLAGREIAAQGVVVGPSTRYCNALDLRLGY